MREEAFMPFVRNGWYATAWSEEITRTPLERFVCGRPVVLYRREDGGTVALDGTCPHRGYPLALGRLHGDTLACGYHGITFGPDGACVAVPGGQRAPAAMRVDVVPLIERGGLVWTWPGDSERADPALCVERWLADPARSSVHFTKIVEARASLLIENLLDLSHETYLHPETIGDEAFSRTPIETATFDDHVSATRRLAVVEPGPFHAKLGVSGKVERSQVAEFWPPGLCLTHTSVTPQAPGQPTIAWTILHCVTPETETRSRYHFAVARNFALGDARVDATIVAGGHKTLDEDVAALDAQERRLQLLGPQRVELSIASDAGALAARKLLLARLQAD
jgi:vanillate O-demethylase monooxygenase subunit